MSHVRKATFVVWSFVTLMVGIPLPGAPGRFLGFFGWQPVEPTMARIPGGATGRVIWLLSQSLV